VQPVVVLWVVDRADRRGDGEAEAAPGELVPVGQAVRIVQAGSRRELLKHRAVRQQRIGDRLCRLRKGAGEVRRRFAALRLHRRRVRAIDQRDGAEYAHDEDERGHHDLDEREASLVVG
jgi:hypothetical protein